MSKKIKTTPISHYDLCVATAKRFMDKVALYDYKSYASPTEEPDVLVFKERGSILFEIKTSLADFKKDQHKECRIKYKVPHWAHSLTVAAPSDISRAREKLALEIAKRGIERAVRFEMIKGKPEIIFIEKEHLGNSRYYVCPWGIIPVDLLPQGWGLYYYRNGKFYIQKESGHFRTNLRLENNLAIHALRRYASGDSTGILINTYEGGKK